MKYQIITSPTKEEWEIAVKALVNHDSYFVKWYDDESQKDEILRILIKNKKGDVLLLYKAVIEKKKIALLNLLNVRCGRRETPGLFFAKAVDNKDDMIKLLLKEIKKLLKKQGVFRIDYLSFLAIPQIQELEKWNKAYKYTQTIDLSKDEDDILREMKPETRRQIKEAKLSQVIIKQQNDLKAISECYEIKRRYFDRKAIEKIEKDSFIKKISKSVDSKRTIIFLAYVNEKVIGFAIIGKSAKKLYYHSGGYDLAYAQNRPMHLLFWEIMKWGKKQGINCFDLCGTGTKYLALSGKTKENWRDCGRTKFKKGFGGKEEEFLKYNKLFILGVGINMPFGRILEKMYWGN